MEKAKRETYTTEPADRSHTDLCHDRQRTDRCPAGVGNDGGGSGAKCSRTDITK